MSADAFILLRRRFELKEKGIGVSSRSIGRYALASNGVNGLKAFRKRLFRRKEGQAKGTCTYKSFIEENETFIVDGDVGTENDRLRILDVYEKKSRLISS